MTRVLARVVLMGSLLVASGCGGGSAPAEQAPAGQPAQPAAAAASPAAPEPASLAELFPQGAGRDLTLNTCGACHAVACSAIGQRTVARWNALKESHRDKLQNTSTADLDAIFGYLSTTFNDSTPEPKIPATFLEGGCTPF